MQISCETTDSGLLLGIENKKYDLQFPKEVWDAYPEKHKRMFLNNFAFLKTLHLPEMLNNGNKLTYNTQFPIFLPSLYKAVLRSIPFCADVDNVSTEKAIKKFKCKFTSTN